MQLRIGWRAKKVITSADVQISVQNQVKSKKKGHHVRRCPNFRPKPSEKQKKVRTSADVQIATLRLRTTGLWPIVNCCVPKLQITHLKSSNSPLVGITHRLRISELSDKKWSKFKLYCMLHCLISSFLSSCNKKATEALIYTWRIQTRLGVVFCFQVFRWSLTCFSLLFATFHQAEIIFVKHLIQGRKNLAWVGVEPLTSQSWASWKQHHEPLRHAVEIISTM